MDTVCRLPDSDARRIEANLLKALERVGNQAVADAIGKDESLISKWKGEGRFAQTALILAVLGLKVVPLGHKCFDPQYIEALQLLARHGMDAPALPTLEWD